MDANRRLLRRGLRVIRKLVRLHPRPFAVAVTGAALYAFATVGSAYVLGWVTDNVILPRFDTGHVSTGTLVAGVVAIFAVGLLKAGAIIMRRLFATVTNAAVGATVRSQIVERYQRAPYAFHQANPTGELLSHASTDVEATTELMSMTPISTGVVIILVTSALWMLATDPILALVAFVLFPTLMGLNVLYQRRVGGPAEAAQDRLGTVSTVAHESFEGALTVKVLGAAMLEEERFGEASSMLRTAKVAVGTTRATFDSMLDSLPGIGIAVLLPVGAYRVDAGAISVGTVVSFVALFTLLVWPVRIIGYLLGEMPRAVMGMERIDRVLAEPVDPRPEHGAGIGGSASPAGAALDVAGVTFAYEPGRAVLDDVTFSVTSGQTLAVVGATGSGKSTLVQLLTGLLPPAAGSIRLDGVNLDELGVAELRQSVATAFQEAFLFGDSVAENILLGADPAELAPAAALAGVTGFAERLPDGFDTVVGERGATLSGGQRQRVALARALARRPRLLLLDDATSAVDPTTEANILASLRHHLSGTTTVIVASRPSTIALADEVLYLEGGRVVAQGRHEALLREHLGYQELVRAYELDRLDRGLL